MVARFSQETAMTVCNKNLDWSLNQQTKAGSSSVSHKRRHRYLLLDSGKEQPRQAMLVFISQSSFFPNFCPEFSLLQFRSIYFHFIVEVGSQLLPSSLKIFFL